MTQIQTIHLGSFVFLSPLLILVACVLLLILLDAMKIGRSFKVQGTMSALSLLFALIALAVFFPFNPVQLFGGAVIYNGFTALINASLLLLLLLTIVISSPYLLKVKSEGFEYFPLIITSAIGMMLLPMTRELVSLIVSIEILSIPLYILSGYNRHIEESKEAGFKYFLLGAFSSSFLIFGAGLIYGSTGSIWLSDIALNLPLVEEKFLLLLGLAMLLVGLGFKLAIVPFHSWVPDVYQGAPSPVVGFMAGAVKLSVLSALLVVLFYGFGLISLYWKPIFIILAVLTMFLGNFGALHQMSLKRLLAYSSISHVGYIITGLVIPAPAISTAIIFYAISYAVAVLGIFALLSMWATEKSDDVYLDDIRGLSQKEPLVALMLAIFLMSLIGVPITAGFLAKLYLFYEVYRAGYVYLVIIAIINSIISVYYYFRVITAMYILPAAAPSNIEGDVNFAHAALNSANQSNPFSARARVRSQESAPLNLLVGYVCLLISVALGIAPRLILLLLNIYHI